MRLTSKKVQEYFAWRTDEELKHCPDCIAKVCNETAIKFNNEFNEKLNPMSLLRLLFFNDPIPSLLTHSYGFNTATGRNIIDTLKYKYYYEYKSTD